MKRQMISAASLLIVAALFLNLSACSGLVLEVNAKTTDLMEGVTPNRIGEPGELSDDSSAAATDFSLRLLKAVHKNDENTLISPASVLSALAMAANGARGETLAQMENVIGMKADELKSFFRDYSALLPSADKYRLDLANSIWFTNKESFTVEQSFLQINADYFNADIYKSPFDADTLKDINSWVNRNTNGMIPSILDEISEDAVMYIINALSFEAEWETVYSLYSIHESVFRNSDGQETVANFMNSEEKLYLNDGNASGFIKYYSGGKYAFAALLPTKGKSPEEYAEALDGKKLHEILSAPEKIKTIVSMPKFETEYKSELSGALSGMGMQNAFHGADFSGIGSSAEGNISIDRIFHKTFISINENGTRAGAATAIELIPESAAEQVDYRRVVLDRPFIYMLIDTESYIPFFIGIMNSIS
ncbi:MAG: serpin family protein [Clostridia bacterium]|nr:serpin family protein [Clostridia bacterium]